MVLAVQIATIVSAGAVTGSLLLALWIALRDRGPGGKHRRR